MVKKLGVEMSARTKLKFFFSHWKTWIPRPIDRYSEIEKKIPKFLFHLEAVLGFSGGLCRAGAFHVLDMERRKEDGQGKGV